MFCRKAWVMVQCFLIVDVQSGIGIMATKQEGPLALHDLFLILQQNTMAQVCARLLLLPTSRRRASQLTT